MATSSLPAADDCLLPSPQAIAEWAGDEHVLLDLASGRYFSLGSVGGFIWERLDGGRDLAAIAGEVTAAFEVGADEALSDVLAFAGELLEAGLVTPPPGAGPTGDSEAGAPPVAGGTVGMRRTIREEQ